MTTAARAPFGSGIWTCRRLETNPPPLTSVRLHYRRSRVHNRRVKQRTLARPEPSPFRRHWALKPGTVFLNHGSFGACSKPILKLQIELRAQMEAEPVQFLWRRYEERLEPSRAELAKFIGARSRDLAFVTNST